MPEGRAEPAPHHWAGSGHHGCTWLLHTQAPNPRLPEMTLLVAPNCIPPQQKPLVTQGYTASPGKPPLNDWLIQEQSLGIFP